MASIISSKKENLPRPFGHFPPSIWGDCFMNFNAQDYSEKLEEYGKEISALKEEVRAKLVDNSITDHVAKMKLIDAVERLGVSYHYEKEIEGLVQQIFEAYAKKNFEGDDDLHTTALLFRVFRQHGYKMPCAEIIKNLSHAGVLPRKQSWWDISAIENLPTDYLKFLFQLVINVYDEIEKEMSTEGRPYAASYAKERIKDLIGSYFVEVTWLKAGYVPTFEEYMRNGRITSDSQIIITSSFIGMKDMADQKAFDWVISGSKTVRATEVIGRLMNDIVSHEEEQTRAGGHVASGVECYMKEHHMNRERAVEEIKTKIKYAWKEINEEFLRPTPMPMHILMRALNLVRTEHVFYKDIDGYTYSRGVKDDIMATYAAPIPI
ncbi:hypothetical protein Ancab_034122 [Ancistrocladus abbreviatus]